jgi:hypothetical protein
VRFVLTPKLLTDPLGQFASRQEPVGLHGFALGMDPARFYRIEPRTPDGQETGENTHPLPGSLDPPVVFLGPTPHFLANVPGGIVPHQEQSLLA